MTALPTNAIQLLIDRRFHLATLHGATTDINDIKLSAEEASAQLSALVADNERLRARVRLMKAQYEN